MHVSTMGADGLSSFCSHPSILSLFFHLFLSKRCSLGSMEVSASRDHLNLELEFKFHVNDNIVRNRFHKHEHIH